ncbi:MAG TPA: SDR family oxidoreductase [Abditibacteriaceae bacterium]|jgi:hypothetical protein
MKKTVLITGASSGIGLELAHVFAAKHDLVLTARREDKLEKLAETLRSRGANVRVLPADLARREAPGEIFAALQDTSIDVLVNNAGFATYGPFAETDLQTELDLLQVNIAALTHLTKLFLPQMVERRSGKILNIASTAAFQPGPLMAVYYASKAYVLHFSEALSNELQGSGVSVSAFCPGPVKSEFQERAQMTSSKLVQGSLMSAHEAALAAYRGLQRRQAVVIPGRKARAFTHLVRLLPRATTAAFVRHVQEKHAESSKEN